MKIILIPTASASILAQDRMIVNTLNWYTEIKYVIPEG